MNYLDDVPSDKAFHLGHKSILNLHGLLFELRSMNDNAYTHYATEWHNYFSDWILNVMRYNELADKLRKTESRQEAIKVLEETIDFLQNPEKEEVREDMLPTEKLIEAQKIEEPKLIEQEKKHTEKHHMKKEAHLEKKKEEPIETKKEIKEDDQPEKEEPMPASKAEMKEFLWKHFAWDMAKEFMYGMAVGILIGLVMSKLFFRV